MVPKWVGPYNRGHQIFTDDGDHEERYRPSCNKAKAVCGNKDPIAMRAEALYNNIPVVTAIAPPDRLAQFNSCRAGVQELGPGQRPSVQELLGALSAPAKPLTRQSSRA